MTSKDKVKFICEVLGDDVPQNFQLRAYEKDVLRDLERLEKLNTAIEIMKTKTVYVGVIGSTYNCFGYNSLMDYSDDDLEEFEYQLLDEIFYGGQEHGN